METLLPIAVVLIPIVIWVVVRQSRGAAREAQRQERQRQAEESQRIEECSEVVRYFANYHGYIARSAVSREELQERIDSGATAKELCDFIAGRVLSADGLELGYQETSGGQFPVILPNSFRDKHIYVVGKSGYGKTNLLRHLILQDLKQGSGVGVLAPEHEMLADELLPFIPDHRLNDVIYFNPADLDQPVVLNPLHLDDGEDIDLRVDETFTIFQRLVGEGGPRMDEILRHSLYALIERPGSTLLDFEPLLDRQDDSFRREIVRTTQEDQTRRFFEHTYSQLPRDSHIPIINRVSRIVRAKYVRNCLCPPKRTSLLPHEVSERLLNIRRAMDNGKILLFNLSDGLLGEVASQLIGQLVVSKIQSATMSRADEPKHDRVPFYLYLDEFQSFVGLASSSYERLLSRGRKYGVGLILSHQQTGQLPGEVLREIFGNVSTMISFQVSQVDAARLAKEFVAEIDFEIEQAPAEEFMRLSIGEAICRIAKNVFAMRVPLVDQSADRERAAKVIELSRQRYGIPRIFADKAETPKSPDKLAGQMPDFDPGEVFE